MSDLEKDSATIKNLRLRVEELLGTKRILEDRCSLMLSTIGNQAGKIGHLERENAILRDFTNGNNCGGSHHVTVTGSDGHSMVVHKKCKDGDEV